MAANGTLQSSFALVVPRFLRFVRSLSNLITSFLSPNTCDALFANVDFNWEVSTVDATGAGGRSVGSLGFTVMTPPRYNAPELQDITHPTIEI